MTAPLNTIIQKLHSEFFPPGYIATVTDYSVQLDVKGLPILFSTEHLALSMGLPPWLVKKIISDSTSYYSSFKIRKVKGGHRWIFAPKDELKYIQKWIKVHILDKIEIHEKAHGFAPKKSIKSNAKDHLSCEIVLNVDLYRYFDTIHSKRVYGIFKNLGYINNLAYDMALLLCTPPEYAYWEEIQSEGIMSIPVEFKDRFILPQGSPASPVITNILSYKLDRRLTGLSQKCNCNYSRYADDLTFSGLRNHLPSIETIKKIIVAEGFYVNEKKIHYIPAHRRQMVTGVVTNAKLSVPRNTIREIESHLHFCKKFGPGNHLRFLEDKGIAMKSNYKQWLIGKISFVNSIDSDKAKKLFEKFNLIEWAL